MTKAIRIDAEADEEITYAIERHRETLLLKPRIHRDHVLVENVRV
jgi:hypothetical protein